MAQYGTTIGFPNETAGQLLNTGFAEKFNLFWEIIFLIHRLILDEENTNAAKGRRMTHAVKDYGYGSSTRG